MKEIVFINDYLALTDDDDNNISVNFLDNCEKLNIIYNLDKEDCCGRVLNYDVDIDKDIRIISRSKLYPDVPVDQLTANQKILTRTSNSLEIGFGVLVKAMYYLIKKQDKEIGELKKFIKDNENLSRITLDQNNINSLISKIDQIKNICNNAIKYNLITEKD